MAECWLNVNEEDDYDIATALRGPDIDAPHLKLIFTERIRAVLGITAYECTRPYTLEARCMPMLATLLCEEIKDWDVGHFLTHTRDAIRVLYRDGRYSLHYAGLASLRDLSSFLLTTYRQPPITIDASFIKAVEEYLLRIAESEIEIRIDSAAKRDWR